jgi:SAM-dependent methyltransferase
VHGDISDPDLPVRSGYDVVDAFDVFFHIVDDGRYRQAIINASAALRDGGYLNFTDEAEPRRLQPMKHYVRRSRAETEDALLEAGFEIVSSHPAFVLMLNPFDGTPLQRRVWRRLKPLLASEHTGGLLGALLYGPELLLTRLKRTGPTTKLFVCRKVAVPLSS